MLHVVKGRHIYQSYFRVANPTIFDYSRFSLKGSQKVFQIFIPYLLHMKLSIILFLHREVNKYCEILHACASRLMN